MGERVISVPGPRALAIIFPVALVLCGASVGTAQTSELRAVQNRIAGLLAHPIVADAGVLVVSEETGEVIFSHRAENGLIPASNMKVVLVATALELLGEHWDCSDLPGALPGEPLALLAGRILKPSDNALADALMEHLPAAAGRPELTPDQLCAEVWGDRGLFLLGASWPDGSGLSRMALISPETLVRMLLHMDGASTREAFLQALPTSGVDGTLRRRMIGTAAQGRVRAKTGTLTGVSALSGYLRTIAGERLVFSIIFNGHTCEHARVRRLQDQICSALVKLDARECRADAGSGH